MKKTRIMYWIFTGLFAALMLVSAIPNILCVPEAVKFMTALGYPVYIIPFLGVARLLGVIAIVAPVAPRLKEWAYAGIFFDLFGAVYSQIASHMPASGWALMSIWLALFFASYFLYHRKQHAPALAM